MRSCGSPAGVLGLLMTVRSGLSGAYILLSLFDREHLVVKEVNRVFRHMLPNYACQSLRGTYYAAVVVTAHEFIYHSSRLSNQ